MQVLKSQDDNQTEWKSSAKQYGDFLAVLRGGTWMPISFDMLDYIDCGHIVSHEAITTDKDYIGYNYKMCKKTYYTDQYVTYDQQQVVTKTAPKWYGAYEYEEAIDADTYVHDDEGGWLGITNKETKLVETSYALAKTTLPSVE